MARKGGHRKSLHFKNKRDYQKWLAYDHMHVKHHTNPPPEVYIHGRKHHVNHSSRKKSSKKKSSRKKSR